jgi:hypothetical protein
VTLEPAVVIAVVSAVTGAIGYVFKQLWESHKESDAWVRTQLDVATTGWRDQTAATNRVADLLEERPRRRR